MKRRQALLNGFVYVGGAAGAPFLSGSGPIISSVATPAFTVVQPTQNRIYQRDTKTGAAFSNGAGIVGISVNLSGAVTSMEYQLRDANSPATVLLSWSPLAGALGAGVNAITPAVPASNSMYLMDVRANGDAASAVNGTVPFAVGELIAISGQSLAVNCFFPFNIPATTMASLGISSPPTAWGFAAWSGNANPSAWGSISDAGPYSGAFSGQICSLLSTKIGVAVGVTGYAVGSTNIAAWQPGQANNTKLKSILTAAGGKFGTFIWIQGHADAQANGFFGNPTAYWTAQYQNIVNDLASSYPGVAFLRAITTIPSTQTGSNGRPVAIENIRAAGQQLAAGSPSTTICVDGMDVPLNDFTHPTQQGMAILAQGYYRGLLKLLGKSAATAGPQILSATRAGTTIHLTLSNGGTALTAKNNAYGTPLDGASTTTPTAAQLASQFGVYLSPLTYDLATTGNPLNPSTVSSATIVDATHVDLILAADPGASVDIMMRMPQDTASSILIGLYDNQTDADGITVGRQMVISSTPVTAA